MRSSDFGKGNEGCLRILHVKQGSYVAPSETFVHARVMNPACARPVPVIVHHISEPYLGRPEIRFFDLEKLHPFRRWFEMAIDYRLHWYPFYHQTILQVHPQLIHAHFSGAGEACLWPARQLRIPLVVGFYGKETNYHIHDPNELPGLKRLYAHADKLICLSNDMKRAMLDSRCPEEKIAVIRLGVDTDLFSGEVLEWQSGQTLELLTVARLHPEKGLNYLLDACSQLKRAGIKDWRLRIIGIGPLETELKKQALELGIDRQVDLVGEQAPLQVVTAMRQAHLFILPSLKETQGVVLQEAQATCTPVIASLVGGVPEGVRIGETGFLVEPGKPEEIVQKILTFVQNPSLFASMGMAARRLVVAEFSRKVEYEQLRQIYYSVLRSSGEHYVTGWIRTV